MADRRSHARHDRLAVSVALGGGVLPSTIATCPACGTLHADLLMIREAIRTIRLPAPPRDLRLPATTPARLRPAGWRRLIRAIGTSRDAVTRPLAMSLTGLGLAGLLLTVLPPVTLPSGSAGTTTGGTTETDVQAPAGGHVGIAGEPAASPTQQVDREMAVTSMADASDSQLLVLSASMLASGGTLLVVRRLTTRSRAVP